MSYEEKRVWVLLAVAVAGYATYLGVMFARAAGGTLVEVDYVAPMLWTIGAAIAAGIVLGMLLGMVGGREKKDLRDREVDRFGEFIGHGVLVLGAVVALILAMLDLSTFWIANVIYLAFVLSAVVASVAKLVAYRSGMPW